MDIRQALEKAQTLVQARQLDEADALCRQIVQQDPSAHPAYYLMGAISLERGQLGSAAQMLERAVRLAPAMPVYLSAYGTLLVAQKKYAEAAEAYRRAIHNAPRLASAHRGLGRALLQLGEAEMAMWSFTTALEHNAPRAETLADMALAQRRLGKPSEALRLASESLQLQPRFAWGHNVMGLLKLDQEDYEAAIASLQQAVEINPRLPEAHNNLARAYRLTGQYGRAIATLQHLINYAPNYVPAFTNLGVALGDVGAIDEAIVAFQTVLKIDASLSQTHGNLLLAMMYSDKFTPPEIAQEHRRWGMMHGHTAAQRPPMRRIGPGERLRIGYVSGDLWQHPVATFFEPLLAHHDPKHVDVFIYSDVERPDEVTARIKVMAPHWTNMNGHSNDAFEKTVRSDQIDILVDLAGHTEQSRLEAFARRLAPVQVTYLGYPGTTGLLAMDYVLGDSWADPPDGDALYTEKVVRLPRCFLCYSAPSEAPLPMARPAENVVTFAVLNRLSKVSDTAMGLWAKIMAATPGSRLILKERAIADPAIADRVRVRLRKAGIDPERVQLISGLPRAQYWSLFNSIDIALDTYPYNGTTITCDSLWMGVPVVSLAGASHVSRVGASILQAIGHEELVAASPEQYVQAAVDLAVNPARRRDLRQTLRSDMSASPLLDGKSLAQAIESAFALMWAERGGVITR